MLISNCEKVKFEGTMHWRCRGHSTWFQSWTSSSTKLAPAARSHSVRHSTSHIDKHPIRCFLPQAVRWEWLASFLAHYTRWSPVRSPVCNDLLLPGHWKLKWNMINSFTAGVAIMRHRKLVQFKLRRRLLKGGVRAWTLLFSGVFSP